MTEHGPTYNVTSAVLAKYRAKARDGLSAMSYEDRYAYGEAVERAILTMQRQEFMRASCEPGKRCGCASGTWHSDGAAIHEAVRQQQRNALLAWPGKVRRNRTDVEWRQMYEEAMQAKAKAIAECLLAGGTMYEEAA